MRILPNDMALSGPTRRQALSQLATAAVMPLIAGGRSLTAAAATALPQAARPRVAAVAVTRGPGHHFFGYYDKFADDSSGRYLLAHNVDFLDRQPRAEDVAQLGRIDTANNFQWLPFAQTTAWCWQQGTMLEWMPNAADRLVRYNARQGERFVTVIADVATGTTHRTLPAAVYAVASHGRVGIALNFSRLDAMRPGYGYTGLADPWADQPAPRDDGLTRVDMTSGATKAILSLADLAALRPRPDFAGPGVAHCAYHVQFNPSGDRFVFLHRWGPPNGRWQTRLMTSDADGRDVRLVSDHNYTSHLDWFDDHTLLAWCRDGRGRTRFFLIPDRDAADQHGQPLDTSPTWKTLGEKVITQDGHGSFSPDRRWLLNDTYPQPDNCRELMLLRLSDQQRFDLGRYLSPPQFKGPWRCDLHPRWTRDGRRLTFDSLHEGHRQVYCIDVSAIVDLKT